MCDQAAWNRSSRRAGDLGGARAGKCRWVRIWAITAGSTIAAMICKRPPQLGQYWISISNTRSSQARANSCAPVNHARARDRRRDRLPAALEAQRSPRAAWRGVRARHGSESDAAAGGGTSAAKRCMNCERRHHDTSGAVSVGGLELQHDLACWIALEPFVGNGRAGDIAAQAFELLALHRRHSALRRVG